MAEAGERRAAQERADRLRTFRRELKQLESEQILVLNEEQRARVESYLDETLSALASRYDVDTTESQKRLSLGMRIVSALGGLALCAAVFLFFYRYWGLIPTLGQIVILIATPLAGLAGMHVVSRRERTLYFTALLAIVVFACFVLNLLVLGQLFNIIPSPNAFLAWGALAIVVAYTYGLRLALAAGLVCWINFLAATIVSWTGAWWQSFYSRPECFFSEDCSLSARPLRYAIASRWSFRGLIV